jgi:isopenicillin N synthase-like dioxygenase
MTDVVEEVPIVDFAPALEGTTDGLQTVASAVSNACTNSGFFYLANHSIPKLLTDRVFECSSTFFELSESKKLEISLERSVNFRGYIPFDARLDAGNRRGTGGSGFQSHLSDDQIDKQPPDAAESFQMHAELPADDVDVLAGKPLHGPNQWPDALPEMRNTLLAYYDGATSLARCVLEVFAVCLDLDRNYFVRFYKKPLMQIRLMHYPTHEAGEHVPFGVRPHSDAGAFSMLLQDTNGGLEIHNKRGEWQLVPPIDGTLVVNIGDTMKLWTNNRFQSTPHRVVNTYGASRYSVPFFANPDYDAVIEPISTCIDENNPPVFDSLHCGESMLHTYSRIWPSASVGRGVSD